MANITKGMRVQQIMPAPFEGEVVEFRVDAEKGVVQAMVRRDIEVDGETHVDERVFLLSDIREITK